MEDVEIFLLRGISRAFLYFFEGDGLWGTWNWGVF